MPLPSSGNQSSSFSPTHSSSVDRSSFLTRFLVLHLSVPCACLFQIGYTSAELLCFLIFFFKTFSLFGPGSSQTLNLLLQASRCWSYRNAALFLALDSLIIGSVLCFALMKYNVNGITFKGLTNVLSASTHISI